jgi:hypothetical protein
MNKKRPEYIKCIQHTHVDLPKTSWCGEKLFSFDWAFQDIDHAVYSVQQGSRQVPCPDCLKKIYEVLNEVEE